MDACLETPRLILRTVTEEDVDQVAQSWNLDEGPISREDAQDRITWMVDNHRQNGPGRLLHLCLAIVLKDGGGFIGWCGLDHRDRSRPHPVLFYLLNAGYRGKGLATEAAAAVLGYAFRELGLAQVDAGAAFDNSGSRRVMEKVGMRYVGLNDEGGHSFTVTLADYLRDREEAPE